MQSIVTFSAHLYNSSLQNVNSAFSTNESGTVAPTT